MESVHPLLITLIIIVVLLLFYSIYAWNYRLSQNNVARWMTLKYTRDPSNKGILIDPLSPLKYYSANVKPESVVLDTSLSPPTATALIDILKKNGLDTTVIRTLPISYTVTDDCLLSDFKCISV